MAHCPDFSDSDDDCFSDDGNYYTFKAKMKDHTIKTQPRILTDVEQKEIDERSLYSALCSENTSLVIKLLEKGFDVNFKLIDRWTPLLLAVSFGNPGLTKELLKRGADINAVRDGCTALMMACNCPKVTSSFERTLEIVKELVEKGANVRAINRKRMTALMFAANNGHLEAVKYLLPLSNKNAEDNQRWTALFWAVNGNEKQVVEYLLEEGLEFNRTDVRNNSPIDLAKHNNFTEILKLFPTEEPDFVFGYLNTYPDVLKEISSLEKDKKPAFFMEICSILCGVRSESVIKNLIDKDVSLGEFLHVSSEELQNLGVNLPFQRRRILGGIHRFHKYPFHPNSLHVVPLTNPYTNIDVAIQLVSTIKQVIAMQASLIYMRKNYASGVIPEEDKATFVKNIENIKNKIRLCKIVINKLKTKAEQWDKCVKAPDLITSKSRLHYMPWRKIIFSLSVVSLVFLIRFSR